MDVRAYNRRAWDRQVGKGNPWSLPVDPETVAAARNGRWSILLTPTKPVPSDWWPDLIGQRVLCLASGGGQQGPILAAAGAGVTVLDNSPKQLAQDRLVAEREGLALSTIEGDMADLGMFAASCFDLIVHPVSNVFVPDVRPVWREAFRVLRPGGLLLAGFVNPATFLFDFDEAKRSGEFVVRYTLPYSDLDQLGEQQKRRYSEQGDPLEFSHTLEDQIGGQLAAGFVLTGFYEDRDREEDDEELSRFMPVYIATRAVKP